MIHFNNEFDRFAITSRSAHEPPFASIIAFDYYDGPESGLAICSSGLGLRFRSLADSHSRRFRAFHFTTLSGDWTSQGANIRNILEAQPEAKILLPKNAVDKEVTDAFDTLESKIDLAKAIDNYIGIGSPDLSCLWVAKDIDAANKVTHKKLESTSTFIVVHKALKELTIQT
jgi:hypothetical protein